MHTIEEIERMFAEMGLGSEQDRAQLLKLAQIEDAPTIRKLTFIDATAHTASEEEGGDG